ncbi:hypothetical protein UVI_02007020 [Ustilaginoidea virens]|uniref:dolichol kinase n=1 Tax=Ustilaginoidea virens TaxID=1159556 RepID=A0A1B5KVZ7_USTVR|nr:hypothetical protein UVI_02007020 [Ustilaginoidea virens]
MEPRPSPGPDEQDALRAMSRTPHPYHHPSSELPHAAERFNTDAHAPASLHVDFQARQQRTSAHSSPTAFPSFLKDSAPCSDSGTEADDEHFLKGLPAPKARLHKGLRDGNEPISSPTTPLPSPAILDHEQIRAMSDKLSSRHVPARKRGFELLRRNRILVRRATEAGIVVSLGYVVVTSPHVSPLFRVWRKASSSVDEEDDVLIFRGPWRVQTLGSTAANAKPRKQFVTASAATQPLGLLNGTSRRHTLSHFDLSGRKHAPSHTPSGRRKRAASLSMRPYVRLTQGQATVRKWVYAAYVYVCIVGIVFAGVRTYVQLYALDGQEPIGWALGYLLGDLPWFRFQIVSANLERWICLPARAAQAAGKHCHLGWVQHLRGDDFGEANTRLILSAYWLTILVFGLVVVFQLKQTYEVDTRRKVFHFMMVGMFLPATYVDPTYAGLALSLILAIFLILDLLRASQLPPLSKPIASFLAPYVDGRDFRGPVVISHIFLLIGCAIPLWLALASLSRTGSGCLAGWEVPTRDVSMVSGVVCVGLGDAAASLIGRRYGRHKWLWGGGKSLEGSLAFAAAVFAGLAAAGTWLRVGGWPTSNGPAMSILSSARNAGICASMASLTEAVLTGGNDNVIVPVMLWTCVKSLGI